MSSGAGVVDQLSEFSGALRRRGLTVTSEQTTDMARAMRIIDLSRRSQTRSALRSLTVTDPSQIAAFDEEFEAFFGRAETTTPITRPSNDSPTTPSTPLIEGPRGTAVTDANEQSGASAVERVGRRDFADLDDDDLAEARRLVMTMNWHPTSYKTRRWVKGDGSRPDLRRTLHGAVGPTGDLMELKWKRRRRRERPLIIIADISGSMERYADLFLVFAYAAQRRLRDVEVFTFSTELTRITDDLARRDAKQRWPGSRTASRTGRAAPGSERRWPPGTRYGVGAWREAARSCSCSPMDGTAVIRRCYQPRWHDSPGPSTG